MRESYRRASQGHSCVRQMMSIMMAILILSLELEKRSKSLSKWEIILRNFSLKMGKLRKVTWHKNGASLIKAYQLLSSLLKTTITRANEDRLKQKFKVLHRCTLRRSRLTTKAADRILMDQNNRRYQRMRKKLT